ncbi:MAG: 3,4-dihydroxy-2-butanone-4-phosphate synthase [Alicyclobacillaceae bacterium]|nr:3,4-dihydroxy-2-butanone-4-phosphate synthase [Alicyclobacillaceae bacterium]
MQGVSRGLQAALSQLAAGRPCLIVDDTKLEPEAAMMAAAEDATPEVVNLMLKHARGMLAVGMLPTRARSIGLLRQNGDIGAAEGTARNYMCSLDAEETTTGISAFERSFTIRKLVSAPSCEGFRRPGHVFPVVGAAGLLYERVSVIEASLELARFAGKAGMTVVCDVLDPEGRMAGASYCNALADSLSMPLVLVSDVIRHRLTSDGLVASRSVSNYTINGVALQCWMYCVAGECYHVVIRARNHRTIIREIDEGLQKLADGVWDQDDVEAGGTADTWGSPIRRVESVVENARSVVVFHTGTAVRAAAVHRVAYQLALADVRTSVVGRTQNPPYWGLHTESITS